MIKAALVTLIAAGLAGQALAQVRPGVQRRDASGIGVRAGAPTKAEVQARRAAVLAEQDNRQREIDDRIAAAQAEVKAIEDTAAAEMRPLTPAETRRVAVIDQRIADAKSQREAAMAKVDDVQERAREEIQENRRERARDIEARRDAAGLPNRGVNGAARRR